MADGYKVGNLEIAFKAVDETSASFKELAKNLRAINSLVTKLGNADLSPFIANIKSVHKVLNPMLKNISGASEGIIALNQSIQKVGVTGISKAANEFNKVKNEIADAANVSQELVNIVGTGTKKLASNVNNASKEYENFGRVISRAEIIAKRLATALTTHTYDRLSKEVSSLASEWKNLYATMQKSSMYDLMTDGLFSERASNRLKEITQSYFAQRQEMDKVNAAFLQIDEQYRRSKMSVEELTIEEYRNQQAVTKQRIEFLQASLALGKAGKNTIKYRKELERLTQQQNKGAKSGNKFLKSIGRIALYRAIRRGLQLITQSITESINEFAKIDDNVNNTMSSITSSLTVLRLSFGVPLIALLQAIEPIINELAIGFANFANIISQALATGDTYWAINFKAIEDYRKQLDKTTNSLASFDKFNALNTQNDKSIFFEKKEVEEGNKSVEKTREIINGIKTAISKLWEFLKPMGSWLVEHLNIVLAGLGAIVGIKIGSEIVAVIGKLKSLGSVLSTLAAHPIILVIAAVAALVAYLYTTNEQFRESLNNLLSSLTPLFSAISNFLKNTLSPMIKILDPLIDKIIAPLATQWLKLLNVYLSVTLLQLTPVIAALEVLSKILQTIARIMDAIFSWNFKSLGSDLKNIWSNWSVGNYAKSAVGGVQNSLSNLTGGSNVSDSSVLSQAPTFGSSAVSTGGAVTVGINATQLKSAFYQALVEYGSTQGDNETPIIINLDGEQVYRSVTKHAMRRGNKWAT